MQKSLFLAIILPAFIGLVTSMCAQESPVEEIGSAPLSSRFQIGITGGVTHDIHSGRLHDSRTVDEDGCPVITAWPDKENKGYMFGIVGAYRINSWLTLRSDVMFALHQSIGRQELPNAKVLLPNPDDPSSPTIIDQTVAMEAEWIYSYTMLGLLSDFTLIKLGPGEFHAMAGLTYGWQTLTEWEVDQNLEEPQNARFINPDQLPSKNDGKSLIISKNQNPSAPSRFSLRSGLGYDFSLLAPLHIQPNIVYDFGLTDVQDGWRMNYLVGQIDLIIEL
ncbi:MAG: hypothetical protein KDD67_12720 [Ignavibacteriae bacterium]|nr:hypothetical protein [Ignavibacteriota bacterium]MCB9214338.1 hypothetical protein [Ignavibacteria bacterium]